MTWLLPLPSGIHLRSASIQAVHWYPTLGCHKEEETLKLQKVKQQLEEEVGVTGSGESGDG